MLRRRNQRFETLPFINAQITRITLSLLACVTQGFPLESSHPMLTYQILKPVSGANFLDTLQDTH